MEDVKVIGLDPKLLEIVKMIVEQNEMIIRTNLQLADNLSRLSWTVKAP